MDDVLLMEEVEKFSFLFDKKDVNFKNKIYRENAWSTIGIILNQSLKLCEQRWIISRNKYNTVRREYKSAPSGCGGDTTKIKWPYFKMMSFLEPFIVLRQTRTSYKSCSSSVATTSGEQARLSQAWNTMDILTEIDTQASNDENKFNECEDIEASEIEDDNTDQDKEELNSLGSTRVTSPTLVVTPSLAKRPIPNETPNNNIKGKFAKKQKVQENEDETGTKIAQAFDNFSKYLIQMRNSQEAAPSNGSDEQIFGQQVAQDLIKISNVEDFV